MDSGSGKMVRVGVTVRTWGGVEIGVILGVGVIRGIGLLRMPVGAEIESDVTLSKESVDTRGGIAVTKKESGSRLPVGLSDTRQAVPRQLRASNTKIWR